MSKTKKQQAEDLGNNAGLVVFQDCLCQFAALLKELQ